MSKTNKITTSEELYSAVPDEVIMQKIFYIRNQKVMLNSDIAELYGTETKRVKEQVRRNPERFSGYVFQLTKEEAEISRTQIATLKRGSNLKYLPYAFTEHGILMLANVLKSARAVA